MEELLRERSRGVEIKLPVLEPEPEEGAELLVDDDATTVGFLVRKEPERDDELEACLCNAKEENEGCKDEPSSGAA